MAMVIPIVAAYSGMVAGTAAATGAMGLAAGSLGAMAMGGLGAAAGSALGNLAVGNKVTLGGTLLAGGRHDDGTSRNSTNVGGACQGPLPGS